MYVCMYVCIWAVPSLPGTGTYLVLGAGRWLLVTGTGTSTSSSFYFKCYVVVVVVAVVVGCSRKKKFFLSFASLATIFHT